jgi:hypothetical protein
LSKYRQKSDKQRERKGHFVGNFGIRSIFFLLQQQADIVIRRKKKKKNIEKTYDIWNIFFKFAT